VYLAEPLVKSQDFIRSSRELAAQTWLWVCEPVVEIANPPEGTIPGHTPASMPREHPFQTEFAQRHRLPMIAVLGGPETMYPEFQKVLEKATVPPPLPPPPAEGSQGWGSRSAPARKGR